MTTLTNMENALNELKEKIVCIESLITSETKDKDITTIVKVLEEENNKLIEQNKDLNRYAGDLERRNKILEEKNSNLEKKDLNKYIEDLERRNKELEKKIGEKQSVIRDLRYELDKKGRNLNRSKPDWYYDNGLWG